MSETVSTETTPEVEKAVSAESVKDSKSSGKKSDKAPKKKNWFSGVKAEFKKIIWPDRQSIVKNTTAVVLVSIFISIAVKVSDLVIQAVLDLLL